MYNTSIICTYNTPEVFVETDEVSNDERQFIRDVIYRQEILKKWNNLCSITGCSLTEILISSHIKGWSECNEDERLDVDNGILLSPHIDSLFDKHLISFEDDGSIMISEKVSKQDLDILGVSKSIRLKVDDGMKKYLKHHRNKFTIKNII